MYYLQNHIWCSESNWDGVHYDCRHLVSLNSYEDGYEEDWEVLIDPKAETVFDEEDYEDFMDVVGHDKEVSKDSFYRDVPSLIHEALQWLHDNVEDRKGEDCNKGWCIGSAAYREMNRNHLTVFFHRKRDAMAFIKRFSKWKKPIKYVQYFTDVRKDLNLETGKYES